MTLVVQRVYGLATIQSAPLLGRRRFGVPPGGPLDEESHALANALVGNLPQAAAVELANGTLELVASEACTVAVAGAVGTLSTGTANASFTLEEGQSLSVSVGGGLVCYLALAGGIVREDAEITDTGQLRVIPACRISGTSKEAPTSRRLDHPPSSLGAEVVRYIAAGEGIDDSVLFQVDLQLDRVGMRLNGLPPAPVRDQASEPTVRGAIQRSPSGQLLITGPDGPTTGGYPKVGYVAEVDLSKLAQLRPGSTVRLQKVEPEEAKWLARVQRTSLERRIMLIRLATSI